MNGSKLLVVRLKCNQGSFSTKMEQMSISIHLYEILTGTYPVTGRDQEGM